MAESVGGPPDLPLCKSAPRHIVLLGPMGSGKTTLGRLLAERLGRVFVDSDEQLRRRFGLSGRELGARSGVSALHAAEVEALIDAVEADEPSVIAAAAAVADSSDAMAAVLRSKAASVILESSFEVLTHRMQEGDHRRSVSLEQFRYLTSRRRKVLLSLAPITIVDTSATTPQDAIDQIMQSTRDLR